MLGGHINRQSYFPSLSICLLLALGIPTWGNALCCSGKRQAPRNPVLEKQELCTNVMIDFFVCFYLGIPAHEPALFHTPSREPLGLYLTRGSHHLSLHLSYPLGGRERDVKLNTWNPEFRAPSRRGMCSSSVMQNFWESASPVETPDRVYLPLLIYAEPPSKKSELLEWITDCKSCKC